jgi:hypothetical protein
MKQILANYFLKIYLRFIVDEYEDIYKNWAKPFIKGTIFVSNIYVWIASIIFFPFFILYMNFEKQYEKFEKEHQKILNIYNK